MIATLIISCLTCLVMVLSVLFKPEIRIKNYSLGLYWIITLIGAIILLLIKSISLKDIFYIFTSNTSANPLKILLLFISMTVLSIFLDEVGFFKYVANKTVKKANGSQYKLFVLLYLVVSVLTIFTSNDIVILTFTPFICYFAKNAKINPIPYLISEFVAANTWSMMLLIGNPTNIYLCQYFGIAFFEYVKVMALPTFISGFVSFLLMVLIFNKHLKNNIVIDDNLDDIKIENKFLCGVGLALMLSCLILLIVSSYIKIEMYIITVSFTITLFIIALIYFIVKKEKPVLLLHSIKRAPFELIPFLLSMFVIVSALDANGVLDYLMRFLNVGKYNVFTYGYASFIMANLVNNIPMSIMFAPICQDYNSLYAAVIGSNIGAFLTPVGALAGIMWKKILKNNDIKFSFLDFIKYGSIISIPTISVALILVFVI